MAGSNSLQPNGIDSLSAANGMNDTKALYLAPVPDSMLIGEAGRDLAVWPTTDQGARGPPKQPLASCC